jgi:hypothetical protein
MDFTLIDFVLHASHGTILATGEAEGSEWHCTL